jgi:hypothetical protein
MLKTLAIVCISVAVAVAPSFGQAPQASTGQKPVMVTGTVKAFEAGKSIEVDAKGTSHKYDLTSADTTYTINPDVAVGSEVKLTERTDSSGHKTVTIEPSGKAKKTGA